MELTAKQEKYLDKVYKKCKKKNKVSWLNLIRIRKFFDDERERINLSIFSSERISFSINARLTTKIVPKINDFRLEFLACLYTRDAILESELDYNYHVIGIGIIGSVLIIGALNILNSFNYVGMILICILIAYTSIVLLGLYKVLILQKLKKLKSNQ